jgi:hypothetical protein
VIPEAGGGTSYTWTKWAAKRSEYPAGKKSWFRIVNAEVSMMSHFFDPDGMLGADDHTRFTLRAITRSGYPYAFGITVEHVLRANFETFTVVLALAGVYFRKVHAQTSCFVGKSAQSSGSKMRNS